jgi:hypothetical protein
LLPLLTPDSLLTADGFELNRRYMALSLPCPFLEDESCSIHPDRPVTCREYLVTLPAEHCADPSPEKVRRIPLRAHVSRALAEIDTHDGRGIWIPLVLSLDWSEAHRDDPVAQRPSAEWIDEVLRKMTGRRLGESAGDGAVTASDEEP